MHLSRAYGPQGADELCRDLKVLEEPGRFTVENSQISPLPLKEMVLPESSAHPTAVARSGDCDLVVLNVESSYDEDFQT